ncbi:MAG TPA: alpha/beta hydrolase, partial [Alcanivorax sp.]|nr:alpha/beta hydrolase [Alcanivorax sp.]
MSRDRLALEGPEGTLEAVLEGETENPAMIAIVCHPHPQFGGTMDNKVVTTLIRAARDAGAAALRFNFRGVGESQGAYSDGIGEVEDLIAVHRWLSKKYPGAPLWLAGFSFGSFVAARGAEVLAANGEAPAALFL